MDVKYADEARFWGSSDKRRTDWYKKSSERRQCPVGEKDKTVLIQTEKLHLSQNNEVWFRGTNKESLAVTRRRRLE